MKVRAIKCKKCGDTVFSRARHDFHWCSCESIFIDGGFDYMRFGGEPENIEQVDIEIDATMGELYNDWNKNIDKFGIVKGA